MQLARGKSIRRYVAANRSAARVSFFVSGFPSSGPPASTNACTSSIDTYGLADAARAAPRGSPPTLLAMLDRNSGSPLFFSSAVDVEVVATGEGSLMADTDTEERAPDDSCYPDEATKQRKGDEREGGRTKMLDAARNHHRLLHTASPSAPKSSVRRPASKRRQSDSPQKTRRSQNTSLRLVHRHPDPRCCRHSFSSLPKKQPRQPREFVLPTPNARSRASCISCERRGSSPDVGESPRGWKPGTPRTPSVRNALFSRQTRDGGCCV